MIDPIKDVEHLMRTIEEHRQQLAACYTAIKDVTGRLCALSNELDAIHAKYTPTEEQFQQDYLG